ncbi:MAG: RDD family protein [Longicatena sp.]|uniref:RDD family protein n=1 Tax=Anaerorhabdus sp. TaxID=1872524 RepID=UPI002FCB7EB5
MSLFVRLYTLFDNSECDVNNGKRFFAYVIDWFLGSLFTMLPMCIMWLLLTKDMDKMAGVNVMYIAGQVSTSKAYLAGLLSTVFALFYYVVIPWKIHRGQTIGKRMMGFKIVQKNNEEVTLSTLIIRQVIGIIIIEGALYNVSGILHSMLSLATNINFISILMYVGLAISVCSGFLVLKINSRRMFHDYLAKTKVIAFEEEEHQNESI